MLNINVAQVVQATRLPTGRSGF